MNKYQYSSRINLSISDGWSSWVISRVMMDSVSFSGGMRFGLLGSRDFSLLTGDLFWWIVIIHWFITGISFFSGVSRYHIILLSLLIFIGIFFFIINSSYSLDLFLFRLHEHLSETGILVHLLGLQWLGLLLGVSWDHGLLIGYKYMCCWTTKLRSSHESISWTFIEFLSLGCWLTGIMESISTSWWGSNLLFFNEFATLNRWFVW